MGNKKRVINELKEKTCNQCVHLIGIPILWCLVDFNEEPEDLSCARFTRRSGTPAYAFYNDPDTGIYRGK